MSNITKSLVPAIASQFFVLKHGTDNYMEPQTCAITAFGIFLMMDYIDSTDIVPLDKMTEYVAKAIAKANTYNNDHTLDLKH
ncbi:hypothetical protein [Photorhabdus sp. CRCIA-P01]|uniref:hypothetical protein n=1 Tax=Photorhabdus sp. CRCIA-P01 TaxID=2019570 RepID=UPI000E59BA70|nr:hypothetical protein [Photorhabdus sp. CRCIA-P01]